MLEAPAGAAATAKTVVVATVVAKDSSRTLARPLLPPSPFQGQQVCWNCGSAGHSWRSCKQPLSPTLSALANPDPKGKNRGGKGKEGKGKKGKEKTQSGGAAAAEPAEDKKRRRAAKKPKASPW